MASNMYLKFEEPTINGTSTAPGHAGEIEVLSWNHGFNQPGDPRSTPPNQDLSFTKYLDAASTELQKTCWSGKQIGKATLRCYRSDGATGNAPVEYLAVAMEHVIISNYAISGGPGDVPVENVSLSYGTIHYDYKGAKG